MAILLQLRVVLAYIQKGREMTGAAPMTREELEAALNVGAGIGVIRETQKSHEKQLAKLFEYHDNSQGAAKAIEVSDQLGSPDYQSLRGKTVTDEISHKSLGFHFENFLKLRS